MTSRVFIPQYPMHWRSEGDTPRKSKDLLPAQDYGEIIVLLPGKPDLNPAYVMPLLHAGLSTFDAKKDYVLTIGHPVLIAWMGIVLAHYTRTARFLDWDRINKFYNIATLSITEGATKCPTPATMHQ